MKKEYTERLTLKWGSPKGWSIKSDSTLALIQKWHDLGVEMSAMMHRDTDEQKKIVCQIIDAVDAETIHLDWEGKDVSKEEAKAYVMNYGTKREKVRMSEVKPMPDTVEILLNEMGAGSRDLFDDGREFVRLVDANDYLQCAAAINAEKLRKTESAIRSFLEKAGRGVIDTSMLHDALSLITEKGGANEH